MIRSNRHRRVLVLDRRTRLGACAVAPPPRSLRAPNVSVVTKSKDQADQARLLRQVLAAFPPEDDSSAGRAIRRRVEGAIIASELAAGEPAPRLAATEPEEPLPARSA